jgi:hypothetical protein
VTRVVPPGSETCGCCEGVEASTPRGVHNRPGLSGIAYRIGTYTEFKESLIAGLSSSDHPQLGRLLTRDEGDFTIGLLDAFACAADVLTFYQERLANESYLRTAGERVSLQEMAKLIGYRLRPGAAAETLVAFALEMPRTPPRKLPPEPGSFVTGIPTSLELERGLKLQSVPGPGEQPQTFETVETIDARPEWNAMQAVTSAESVAGKGATEVWVQGGDTNLKAGDWLLVVGAEFAADPHSERWDARVLTAVEVDDENQRTRLAWSGGLDRVSPVAVPDPPPTLYALRQRASAFGHNAPLWRSMSRQFRADYLGLTSYDSTKDPGDWPDFDIHFVPPAVSHAAAGGAGGFLGSIGSIGALAGSFVSGSAIGSLASSVGALVGSVLVVDRSHLPVSLDATYPKVVAPGLALLVTPAARGLYRITSVSDASRAQFAISGKSTCIALSGKGLGSFSDEVRSLSIYVQSERLRGGSGPKTTPVSGSVIEVAADPDGPQIGVLPAGRRIVVKGARQKSGRRLVHVAKVVSAAAGPGGSTVLTIDPPLPTALRRDSVVVYGNVALATRGESATQILGAGDASRVFQRLELKRTPLTYRAAANEIGAKSELSVRVGDVEWSERPTPFGAGRSERAYTVSTDENGKTWVVFGDGQRGARLPSGVNNVRATYRQGLGADGNVAADQLTQLMTRPAGLKSAGNPRAASGGTDPEPADQARRTMPLGTRTLGRVVSLLDYEDFALAFTGIAKAQARVLELSAGTTIAITVAGQDGAPLLADDPVRSNLLAALLAGGDPHVSVALLSFQASTFRLGLKVKRDPAYEGKALFAAVEKALRDHYSFAARELGAPVLQSDVIATVHSVPGVVAVDLDFLYGGTAPVVQTAPSLQPRLLASRLHVSGGVAQPAELLTLHPGPLDQLEEMT